MANVDRPNGFRPAKTYSGAPWNSLVRRYEAADRSSDTTNNHGDIYVGDPVALSSGKVIPANSGATIIGVCVGVGKDASEHGEVGMFNPDNLEQRYLGHAETGYVWVVPKEHVLFEVQTASDLDLVPGGTADITTDATEAHGSRTTGLSSCELTTSANADVTVVENVTTPNNDVTLANARHLVKFA